MTKTESEGESIDPNVCCPRHRDLTLSGAIEIELVEDVELREGVCPICACLHDGPLNGLPEEAGALLEGSLMALLGKPALAGRILTHGARTAADRWLGAVKSLAKEDDDDDRT